MVAPGTALLFFGVLLLTIVLLFWPSVGVWARVRRLRHLSERVLLEDALKHLYHHGGADVPASMARLAGALEISRDRAVRLVERLGELALASLDGDRVSLTREGREYALRILRTHRLWERYLADRTGVSPSDWHEEAERKEHQLSAQEADRLAARMGHPIYDPHGDPIPTATGAMPPSRGRSLAVLSSGARGVIVHLEDEPPEVFAQLVEAGFATGMAIRVLGVDGNRMAVEVGGRAQDLSLLYAGNVTVASEAAPVEQGPALGHTGWDRTLADLPSGEEAPVLGLSPACQGTQRRRLLDLGVVPGTVVRAEMVSAGGNPIAYRIRGALIALRREQAQWIGIGNAPTDARGAA